MDAIQLIEENTNKLIGILHTITELQKENIKLRHLLKDCESHVPNELRKEIKYLTK